METGERLGRYQLVRRLAHGHRTDVWVALQWGDGDFVREVVLKRLLPHVVAEPNALAAFQREARVLAALHHVGVPVVHDLRRFGDDWILVREHVAGPTLAELRRAELGIGRRTPIPFAIALCIELCDVLTHVHATADPDGNPAGLVHGNLAPENVVLGRDGQPRLVDFDTATHRSERIGLDSDELRGTLGYIAPEQIDSEEVGPIDARADLFAVGILLYELTTGLRLYEGDGLTFMTAVLEREARPPTDRRDDYPAELEPIVLRALARDPAERYPNADAFRSALSEYYEAQQLPATTRLIHDYVETLFPAAESPREPVDESQRPPPDPSAAPVHVPRPGAAPTAPPPRPQTLPLADDDLMPASHPPAAARPNDAGKPGAAAQPTAAGPGPASVQSAGSHERDHELPRTLPPPPGTEPATSRSTAATPLMPAPPMPPPAPAPMPRWRPPSVAPPSRPKPPTTEPDEGPLDLDLPDLGAAGFEITTDPTGPPIATEREDVTATEPSGPPLSPPVALELTEKEREDLLHDLQTLEAPLDGDTPDALASDLGELDDPEDAPLVDEDAPTTERRPKDPQASTEPATGRSPAGERSGLRRSAPEPSGEHASGEDSEPALETLEPTPKSKPKPAGLYIHVGSTKSEDVYDKKG